MSLERWSTLRCDAPGCESSVAVQDRAIEASARRGGARAVGAGLGWVEWQVDRPVAGRYSYDLCPTHAGELPATQRERAER